MDAQLDPVEYGIETVHETVAAEADRLVNGNREADYGHPRENMQGIADFWNAYLHSRGLLAKNVFLLAKDVPQMQLLMKVARFATGAEKRDTVVDQAGYAEVTARVIGLDP